MEQPKQFGVASGASVAEADIRESLVGLLKDSPIPPSELIHNLGLYMTRQSLSRIFFMQEMYSHIINTHGVVMEFGVRWGQNLSLFQSFRGMYEPFNYNRMIVGFDSFSGFPSVDEKDGTRFKKGDYGVTDNYEEHLNAVLHGQEQLSPIPHKKKYRLVKGDATTEIVRYFEEHPETVVALAYFDFDIYTPTKACLEALLPRLTRGAVIGFDELNCPEFPGETLAVMETIGLNKYKLVRSPLNPLCSYMIID